MVLQIEAGTFILQLSLFDFAEQQACMYHASSNSEGETSFCTPLPFPSLSLPFPPIPNALCTYPHTIPPPTFL